MPDEKGHQVKSRFVIRRRRVSELIDSTLDVQPSGHSSSFNVNSDTLIAEAFVSFRQCLDVWSGKVDMVCVFTADGRGPLPLVFV